MHSACDVWTCAGMCFSGFVCFFMLKTLIIVLIISLKIEIFVHFCCYSILNVDFFLLLKGLNTCSIMYTYLS